VVLSVVDIRGSAGPSIDGATLPGAAARALCPLYVRALVGLPPYDRRP
jgi:hypothetical protein